MIAAHPVLGLGMADDRLDGRSSAHLASDRVRHPPLLAGGVDLEAMFFWRVVALVAGVGDDALKGGSNHPLDLGNDSAERVERSQERRDFADRRAKVYTNNYKAVIMTTSTTMTIRVSPEVKEKLSRLAHGTRRSKSYLAAEAVSAYVERELEIIEGIQRGLADVEAGRVVSHDDAMAEVYAVIEAAQGRKA